MESHNITDNEHTHRPSTPVQTPARRLVPISPARVSHLAAFLSYTLISVFLGS
jgi:hypothetical protein